jgi:polyisoprenoid-binding protein YceI
MMISTVRGGFKEVSGTLDFNREHPEKSSVEATINAASIWTGVADRDAHLRSADFFEVEKYPTITFKSTKVEVVSKENAKITGDLTIRDVTRPVTLNVELLGEVVHPFSGATILGFTAKTKINREDFGLTWNHAIEAGGVMVGKEIAIELDVEAIPVQVPAGV